VRELSTQFEQERWLIGLKRSMLMGAVTVFSAICRGEFTLGAVCDWLPRTPIKKWPKECEHSGVEIWDK